MAKSEFGKLYDALGSDPSDALQAAFITWARSNLPNTDVPTPSTANDPGDGTSFSTAGQKVDYLVKCYRSRENTAASYGDAMTHILNKPENAALKVAFSKETGRGRQ